MRQLVPIYVALNAAAFITHHDRQRPAQKWRWHVFRYIELRPLWWQVIIWEPPIVERVYNGVFFFKCTMLSQRMSQQLNKDGQKMLARDSNVLQTEKNIPCRAVGRPMGAGFFRTPDPVFGPLSIPYSNLPPRGYSSKQEPSRSREHHLWRREPVAEARCQDKLGVGNALAMGVQLWVGEVPEARLLERPQKAM